jgi:hypothetical protein
MRTTNAEHDIHASHQGSEGRGRSSLNLRLASAPYPENPSEIGAENLSKSASFSSAILLSKKHLIFG